MSRTRPRRWLTSEQREWVMFAFDDFARGWLNGEYYDERAHFVALLHRRTRAAWHVPVKLSAIDRQICQLERRKVALSHSKKLVEISLHGIESQLASARSMRNLRLKDTCPS